ncbi:hypothetical protein Bbelb_172300 [Branchiostoma belcheri]|nr:hypothetical protein Bbelb_172300 [Branchiostoma belcheri]
MGIVSPAHHRAGFVPSRQGQPPAAVPTAARPRRAGGRIHAGSFVYVYLSGVPDVSKGRVDGGNRDADQLFRQISCCVPGLAPRHGTAAVDRTSSSGQIRQEHPHLGPAVLTRIYIAKGSTFLILSPRPFPRSWGEDGPISNPTAAVLISQRLYR